MHLQDLSKGDGLVKSRKILFSVIPAKAGIQCTQYVFDAGSGLLRTGYGVRYDDSETFYGTIKRWMRKRPDMDNDIAEALKLLVVNAFAPQLETHKLKGKLSNSWACSAGYDLRIVFNFVKAEKG